MAFGVFVCWCFIDLFFLNVLIEVLISSYTMFHVKAPGKKKRQKTPTLTRPGKLTSKRGEGKNDPNQKTNTIWVLNHK